VSSAEFSAVPDHVHVPRDGHGPGDDDEGDLDRIVTHLDRIVTLLSAHLLVSRAPLGVSLASPQPRNGALTIPL
jgi:hypothetical protein